MAKYDEAYFENLTKEANVIYRCLYLNEINDNLKEAITSYLDVYFDAYRKYSNLEHKDENLTKIFNILSGPINEVDNPYNLSLNEGAHHPAVTLIKDKLQKFYDSMKESTPMAKGNSRSLTKDFISGIKLYNDENGFTKAIIIIGITILLGLIIAFLTIYHK